MILATVRSDNGGEFHPDGPFGDLCRERGIKQEMSPEENRDAERALAFIETSAMTARIQAGELYPGIEIPNHDWLWAEIINYMVDCLNRSATSADLGFKSPFEL